MENSLEKKDDAHCAYCKYYNFKKHFQCNHPSNTEHKNILELNREYECKNYKDASIIMRFIHMIFW